MEGGRLCCWPLCWSVLLSAAMKRTGLGHRLTAVDYCFLGDSHALRKSLEEAIKCYAMALALNPRHPRSLRNKTLCLIDAGKGDAARQALSEYRRLSGETNEIAQIRWMIDGMGHE